MKRSTLVAVPLKRDDVNPEAKFTTGLYSANRGQFVVASLLPIIEFDIEFEELEEKTAPQSDTTYLDTRMHTP
jgi:hypothetical protein